MELHLETPVSPLVQGDEETTKEIATALNILGYWKPNPKIGLVPFGPNYEFFDAVKTFQREHDLCVDGVILPGGETERAINAALHEQETGDRYYLWRTVRDGKTRPAHAARDGKLFRWNEKMFPAPAKHGADHPGEDYNCRCWAEPYMRNYKTERQNKNNEAWKSLTTGQQELLLKAQDWVKWFDKKGYVLSKHLLLHYLDKTGTPVKITAQGMEDSIVLRNAMALNRQRFEDSMTLGFLRENIKDVSAFKDQIIQLKDSETITLKEGKHSTHNMYWDVDISRYNLFWAFDQDTFNALGAVKLRSYGVFKATRKSDVVIIHGQVEHEINDTYDFNEDTIIDRNIFYTYIELAKEKLAAPFKILGSKKETVSGIISLENGTIKKSQFYWKKDIQ